MPEHIEVYIFGCLLETLARLKDPMVLKSFKNHRRYLVGPFTRDLAWEHCDAIGRRLVDAYAYAKWLVLVFERGVSLCFSMGLASYVTSASEDELANSIPFRDEANLVFTLTFAGYERNVVFVGCNESTAGQVTNVRRFFSVHLPAITSFSFFQVGVVECHTGMSVSEIFQSRGDGALTLKGRCKEYTGRRVTQPCLHVVSTDGCLDAPLHCLSGHLLSCSCI